MTQRIKDINGWFEVKGNPLSKVGVFDYLGSNIDPNGEFGLDPNKTYPVFRSAEELSCAECIESFKLIPWIDNHVMLGEGLTPADKKGVDGVIGEDVYFDDKDETLKGNIKLFAESLAEAIEGGKRELSCGYRCKYQKKVGNYGGKSYNFVQTGIRGNHLASVDQGRMGPSVAVQDGLVLTFTMDMKEMSMTLEELVALVENLAEMVKGLTEKVTAIEGKAADMEESEEDKAKQEAAEKTAAEKIASDKKGAADAKKPDEEKKTEAMDSLLESNGKLAEQVKSLAATVDGLESNGMKTLLVTVGKRDALALKLSDHVGVFDHSEMTLEDVAAYGIDKLEIECDEGQALSTLNGFLAGSKKTASVAVLDSAESMDSLDAYIKREDK